VICRLLLIILLTGLGGCSTQKSQGESLVEKSILAHGGLKNYSNLQDFRYEKTSYTLDAQEIINDTLVQPFKLKDKGTQIEYLGLKSPSFSEKPLEQIKVTYPNSNDIWYFFFDHETK